MMASTITSLTRSLQGDGWWYSAANDWYTRLWDDEMQYGQIRDGKFERIYPHPVMVKKDPCDPGNWRDGDDAMGDLGRAEAEEDRLNEQQYAEPTMADVGEVSIEDEERDIALHGRSYQARLRDKFAVHAMQALVNNDRISDPKGLALRAYEYADAMMIAREMKR